MEPTDVRRHNNFDLVRIFAAAQVLFTHSVFHLKLPIPDIFLALINALPGVPIFFVTSGFLIAGSYIRQRDLRYYATSRALRIYPALWANLAGITLLLALSGGLTFWPSDARFWLWHFLAFVFASDHIATSLVGGLFNGEGLFSFYPSGVLWTLPVELSFYVLVPLVLAKPLGSRRLYGISLVIWAALSLACYFFISRVGTWILFIGLYLWIFLLGSSIQIYRQQLCWLFDGKVAYWLTGHLVLTWTITTASSAPPVYVMPSMMNILHTCTLAGLTISAAFTLPTLSERLLRGRDISYGLYLWHMPVICTVVGFGLLGSWWAFAAVAAVSILLAVISRQFVELPALTLKQGVAVRVAVAE